MEQNPMELIDSVKECMKVVATTVAKEHDIVIENIKGIGITNQRETTILWDKTTGKCFYNAIGQFVLSCDSHVIYNCSLV